MGHRLQGGSSSLAPVGSSSPGPARQLSPGAADFFPSGPAVVKNIKLSHETQQLDFMYFNARSIKNKLAELHSILYHDNISVICISESWLTSDMSAGLIDPKSKYTIYRCDRKNRDGGGVCILVSKQLNSTVIDCTTNLTGSYELIGCRLHSEGQLNLTCDITIFCVYLPPDIASDDFIQAMSDI